MLTIGRLTYWVCSLLILTNETGNKGRMTNYQNPTVTRATLVRHENLALTLYYPGKILCYPYRLMEHIRTEPHGVVHHMEDLETGMIYEVKIYVLGGIHPNLKKHRVDNLKKLSALPSFVYSFDVGGEKYCLSLPNKPASITSRQKLGAIGRHNTPEYVAAFPKLPSSSMSIRLGTQSKVILESNSFPIEQDISFYMQTSQMFSELSIREQTQTGLLSMSIARDGISIPMCELEPAWKQGVHLPSTQPPLQSQEGPLSHEQKTRRRRKKKKSVVTYSSVLRGGI